MCLLLAWQQNMAAQQTWLFLIFKKPKLNPQICYCRRFQKIFVDYFNISFIQLTCAIVCCWQHPQLHIVVKLTIYGIWHVTFMSLSSENVSTMMPKMMFRPMVVKKMKKVSWYRDSIAKFTKELARSWFFSTWKTNISWF